MENLTKREQVIIITALLIIIATIGIIMLNYNGNKSIEINTNNSEKTTVMDKENESIEEEKKFIYVHVKGQVNNVSVVKLEEGKRVIDAIELAGGATANANTEIINLAAILRDGQEVYVPSNEEDIPNIQSQIINNQSSSMDNKININIATVDELQKLPGIGPATAKEIVSFREKNAEFKTIEDIMNVPGIAEGKFNRIKDLIEVY